MNKNASLQKLIAESFQFQKILFYGMGLVAAVTGVVILVLMIVIPAKPDEATVVFYLKITAVFFILFGFWCVWYVRRRISQVCDLLFIDPSNLSYIQPVTVTKNGISGYAIRLYTSDGKMIGFNVTSAGKQKEILEALKNIFPDVSFKD